ncbi:MAG: pseudouridine synthase [Candidatus Cryptobacteroides sp.]
MEEYSKNGRKLRPRKATGPAYSTSTDFHGGQRQSRTYSDKPHRTYQEQGDRPRQHAYGDRPQRPYGDRPQHSYGDRPQRPYGERPSRPHSERPYSEHQSRPYGERQSRPYGDRPQRNSAEQRPYGDRPQRRQGPKPSQGKKFSKNNSKKTWTAATEAGIDRMISRRPQVAAQAENYSDNDYVKVPIQEEVRLNKFIANSGVCSRREADTLIQAGVVTVNGEVVTELGTKVNIYKDEVKFNGEKLKGEEKVYLVMNKPKGYVTTASDPHAEKTVMDLLKGCRYRVFPVGRLDKNTTGVLMFTNDGEIAERLTHPSYDKKKIYQVSLNKPLEQEDFDKILAGVVLSDGEVRADELEFIDADDHRKLGIEIHSGKNRIVRRIFESLGYEVKALDRVYFAGLTKKGLKKGEWRQLTEGEVNILKMGAYV